MADMFGQDTQFGGAIKANLASVTFTAGGGDAGLGVLVQNFRSGYLQNVSRVWELAQGNRTYFIVGRSQGDINIGRIVGPEQVSADFITRFSNACNVKENVMQLNMNTAYCSANGRAGSGKNRLYSGCLVNGMSLQTEAQSMIVQEQVGLMFVGLQRV